MTDGGKHDLGAVYDRHMRHEFVDLDLDLTMATMIGEPHTYFAPTLGGGAGREGVAGFYKHHFIGATSGRQTGASRSCPAR